MHHILCMQQGSAEIASKHSNELDALHVLHQAPFFYPLHFTDQETYSAVLICILRALGLP